MAGPHMVLDGDCLSHGIVKIAGPVQRKEAGHLLAGHRVIRAKIALWSNKEAGVGGCDIGKARFRQHDVDILGHQLRGQLAIVPVNAFQMRRLRRIQAIAALCCQCRHQLVIDGINGNHRVFR